MPNPITFSLVIPVHNNASTLLALFEKVTTTIKILSNDFEFIFVNDVSSDNSQNELKTISNFKPELRIIELTENIGQWEATLLGMCHAQGEFIVTLDADLQYSPEDILKLYRHLKENSLLLVYGIPSRMLHGAGYIRNKLQNLILTKSWTSSFKILHRAVVFDNQNRFLPRRHFEAYEKFHLPPEKKSWIEVTSDTQKVTGFRRHILRNTNILLTYLPEYNLHFRHPLVFTGIALAFIAGILASLSSRIIWLSVLLLVLGILMLSAGISWMMKYNRVIKARKKLLIKP